MSRVLSRMQDRFRKYEHHNISHLCVFVQQPSRSHVSNFRQLPEKAFNIRPGSGTGTCGEISSHLLRALLRATTVESWTNRDGRWWSLFEIPSTAVRSTVRHDSHCMRFPRPTSYRYLSNKPSILQRLPQ